MTHSGSLPRADVSAFLRRSAQVAPSTVAVAHQEGQYTYRELMSRVSAMARTLPTVESRPEPIAVVTDHDAATPELYFGVMAAGHAVVPISGQLPDQAIARIAETAGIRLGVLAPSTAPRLSALSATADATRWVSHPSDASDVSLPDTRSELPIDTAMVCFTSGTTGQPKGVILTHTNLTTHGLTAGFVFRARTPNCHINPLPLAHYAGASRAILAVVNAGTHVVLPEFDPGLVFEAISRWAGTHLTVVPSMATDLLAAEPERFDLQSLETLIYGAAPMPMPTANELATRMSCGLINGYGLTESSGLATALDAEAHRLAVEQDDEELLDSVGKPVPGVELRILDNEHEELPQGEVGEIALRGMKVSPGYLHNPQATAERYLSDGWILTGDQGRATSEQNMTLLGRIDDMIITGGLNVQPLEVENEASLIEGVAACAAFAVSSEQWGQEVHLALVPVPGADVRSEEVRNFLRDRLHRHKVPKVVHIVDRLPRSSVGKVQRHRLAEELVATPIETV